MNTRIRILFVNIFILGLAVTLQGQEMRVLTSDASGMTVEYRPEIRVVKAQYNNREYTRYDIQKADLFSFEPGDPAIPARTEVLGLPGVDGHTVSVLQADYREEQNIRIMPNEGYRYDKDTDSRVATYEEGETYRNAGWIPESAAEMNRTGIARDRIIGNLALYPVQWDPGRRVARLYTRMIVRIDFGPRDRRLRTAKDQAARLPFEGLNKSVAQNWEVVTAEPLRKQTSTLLVSGSWYSIPITQKGMYKLSKAWFEQSGIDVNAIDPRTIKMYSNGGKELSASPLADALEGFQEIAIQVEGQDDGKFDANDFVVFYGKGLNGWDWDNGKDTHYIHRFAFENSYYLTFGGATGKRMQTLGSMNFSTPLRPQWFTDQVFVEDEEVNLLQSGKLWVGKRLVPGLGGGGDSKSYTMKLPGLIASQPVKYILNLYSRADHGTTNSFSVTDNGVSIAEIQMGTVDLGTDSGPGASLAGEQQFEKTINYPDNRSVITVKYRASDAARNLGGFIDWIEWHYPRGFVAEGDELWFSAPPEDAVAEYTLNGFSMSGISIYDVTDVADPRLITGLSVSGGTVTFQAESNGAPPRKYAAAALPAFKVPGNAFPVENSSLQSESEQADFIIITSADFIDAASTLKAYREQPGRDYLRTRVVTMKEIYSAFNCGVPDPTAIRNFLKYAVERWQTSPRFVLLLGDGNYDYKNITTEERSIVPTWQSDNSTNLLGTYPTDDYYVQVRGNDKVNDLSIGRLPAGSLDEARVAVDKTIGYDAESDFGSWRNRVTFVADDNVTTKTDSEEFHTYDIEYLGRNGLAPGMEAKKIYIVSYKTENTAQGRRKPDANRAIIDQINEGTIAITYYGHGGASVWAHESILLADVSVPQMKNDHRLTFVSAATCTFGLYDAPGIKSGTELMMLKPDGGAIASLTAPRVVIAGQNAAFTKTLHEYMFIDGRESDGRAKRMGETMYNAKQRHNSDAGYEKFHFLGDPTQRIKLPQHHVSLDQIRVNDQPVSGDSIQLKALSKVTFEASVRRADASLINDFNGTAQVSLYDSEINVPVPEFSGNYSYEVQGGLLYRGQATISSGLFSVTFIMPKDISYQNKPGRVRFYIDNQSEDGAGYSVGFNIGGSDTTGEGDEGAPELALYMDSRRFNNGDIVSQNSTMLADLFDVSGINTTGLGIGHNIEVWLNDGAESIIVNDYYRGDPNSYQKGVVEYPFKDLPLGRNTLRLRVWDIFNNSTSQAIEFNVVSGEQLSLGNVYNVPNPMTEQTVFTFQYNRAEPVDAEIKIYTLSGRLVKTIEQKNITDRFVRVAWDGRDADGDQLANGVYFYKVALRMIDGGAGSEALGKLTVLR